MHGAVAAELLQVLQDPTSVQAEALLKAMVERYRKSATVLADWLEANVPESLTVLALPPERAPPTPPSASTRRSSAAPVSPESSP